MKISLRLARESDLELMMAWRSQPAVYNGFFTQNAPLTWEEHWNWYHTRGPHWRIYIIRVDDGKTRERDVGVITVAQLEYWEPETGLYVGEVSLWGKHVASEALTQVLGILKDLGYKYTRTTILDSNEASKALYKSLGFYRLAEARLGESLYRKSL